MKTAILTVIVAMGAMPLAAATREVPSEGVTIQEVVVWLQSMGYQTDVKMNSSDGANVADSSTEFRHIVVTNYSPSFGVYLFDCKNGRCGSLQFHSGFNTHGSWPSGSLNDWNRTKRWGRSYTDSVNDPHVEMDVDLTPGGTYELLADELATWKNMLGSFTKFIRWAS